MTVMPVIFLIIGSFMKIFGHFGLPEPWTIKHWSNALSHPQVLRSLWNTLILGGGSAAIGMLVFSLLAYLVVQTKFLGRPRLDFLTLIPTGLPGAVIALGQLFLL